jgi:hypothetical protein
MGILLANKLSVHSIYPLGTQVLELLRGGHSGEKIRKIKDKKAFSAVLTANRPQSRCIYFVP